MGRSVIPRFTQAEAMIAFAALQVAVRKVGGSRKLCAMLGISPQAIAQWKIRALPIPMHLVPLVVDIAQNPLVTPYTLRPDLWRVWKLLDRQLAACGVFKPGMLPRDPSTIPVARRAVRTDEPANNAQEPA